MLQRHLSSTLFPYTTLFRSHQFDKGLGRGREPLALAQHDAVAPAGEVVLDRDHLEVLFAGEGLLPPPALRRRAARGRSEEHTSELQSRPHLVCRLLLEKKK